MANVDSGPSATGDLVVHRLRTDYSDGRSGDKLTFVHKIETKAACQMCDLVETHMLARVRLAAAQQ